MSWAATRSTSVAGTAAFLIGTQTKIDRLAALIDLPGMVCSVRYVGKAVDAGVELRRFFLVVAFAIVTLTCVRVAH